MSDTASDALQLPAPPASTTRYPGRHVYGGGGALKFEIGRHQTSGMFVVMVDGTRSMAAREYDWSAKVTIQLTDNEALMVFAVLAGIVTAFETAPHGEAVKKFRIDDQTKNFYVRVSDRSQMIAVPVSPLDAAQLCLLLGRGILEEHPYLENFDGVVRFCGSFVKRMPLPKDPDRSTPAPAPRPQRTDDRSRQPATSAPKAAQEPRTQEASRAASSTPKASTPVCPVPPAVSSNNGASGGHDGRTRRFSLPATLEGIAAKTTELELDRSADRVKQFFKGEDLTKCMEAIDSRRREIAVAMAG